MTVRKYDPTAVETKRQQHWEDKKVFSAKRTPGRKKKYVLSMFPYPSGALHMGHVINYTISDVIVRYAMMQGFDVLSPIGWDSFGLPAENAAIKQGIHPSITTRKNIAKMKEQMHRAGWGFDWDREISTSEEDYYKWTQWIFLQFWKKGLVEYKKAPVNWCPSCMTVLANEQVHDGHCERCDTGVEQKDLWQWFYAMSRYADKLLDNHKNLDQWPERVIKMQAEWIGRSEGARVKFLLEGSETEFIEVFTTRPDTLWGVTFMSLAPAHEMAEKLVAGMSDAAAKITEIRRLRGQGTSELEILGREKEGVFTGRFCINPVNGERVQIWVANFVLMNYGTGAVMAVPTHDQRDYEFAKKYDIPLTVVIQPEGTVLDAATMNEAFVDDGILVHSAQFTGRGNREAMHDIIEWLAEKGYGEKSINYRLRDWLLSRQRYWGAPIPIVHCEKCGTVPIPEAELPVKLPMDVAFKPTGESPLKSCDSFMNVACPQCGGAAKRDPDTMDTFVDSSWYYLRYMSPQFAEGAFNPEDLKNWGPVDVYIGGVEHATMHLIYFRFFALVLHDLGLIDFVEPATKLFCQGMVCKTAHYCETHKWLAEEEVLDGKCAHCGATVRSEVAKMSKTKLNVVSPETIIEKFGADTMRVYILSDNPPDRDQIWNDDGVIGTFRFLNRLWDTCQDVLERVRSGAAGDAAADKELRFAAHSTLQRCRLVYEQSWQFNTAMARINELQAAFRKHMQTASAAVLTEALEILVKVVAPVAPHICEELWQELGHGESIFTSDMPEVDEAALVRDEITIVVQVNGKLRTQFTAAPGTAREELEATALALEATQKHIEGKDVKKIIVVPGKLVNIVAV